MDEEDCEGQDEATVRPVEPQSLDLAHFSYFIRANFRLANGVSFLGLVTVSRLSDDGLISIEGDEDQNADRQPIIITSEGQVGFWFGARKPSEEDLLQAYSLLGSRDPLTVFPIQFKTEIPLSIWEVRGAIAGFLHLEDKEDELSYRVRVAK